MRWLPEVATALGTGRSRDERLFPWPKNLTKPLAKRPRLALSSTVCSKLHTGEKPRQPLQCDPGSLDVGGPLIGSRRTLRNTTATAVAMLISSVRNALGEMGATGLEPAVSGVTGRAPTSVARAAPKGDEHRAPTPMGA